MAKKRPTPTVRMQEFNAAMMLIGRSNATTPKPSAKRYRRKSRTQNKEV